MQGITLVLLGKGSEASLGVVMFLSPLLAFHSRVSMGFKVEVLGVSNHYLSIRFAFESFCRCTR